MAVHNNAATLLARAAAFLTPDAACAQTAITGMTPAAKATCAQSLLTQPYFHSVNSSPANHSSSVPRRHTSILVAVGCARMRIITAASAETVINKSQLGSTDAEPTDWL